MLQETVLVIDDSPTILKVVQLVLTKAGFKVLTASDGEEGVRRARETHPSLILLDFVMPKMNGYQVCRALGESGELKDVPVVLMSAKGDQVGERFVKVMGIVDYITKPFSPEAITAVVQHTIGKYGRGNGVAADASSAATEARADDPGEEELPHREATAPRTALALGGSAERRLDALAALREGLIDALVSEDDSHDFETLLRRKLDDGILGRLFDPLARTISPGADDGSALRGNLTAGAAGRGARPAPAAAPVGHAVGGALVERQPRRRAAARVDVLFKQGKVELTLAEGLGEEFLVGRYLVDQQALSRQDLESVSALARTGHQARSASSWSSSATSPRRSSSRRWRARPPSASTSSCAGRPGALPSSPRVSCRLWPSTPRWRSTSTAS